MFKSWGGGPNGSGVREGERERERERKREIYRNPGEREHICGMDLREGLGAERGSGRTTSGGNLYVVFGIFRINARPYMVCPTLVS